MSKKLLLISIIFCYMFAALPMLAHKCEMQPQTSEEEKLYPIILNTFFTNAINETAIGYVLYDKKPVCLISFSSNEFIDSYDRHRNGIFYKLAFEELKEMNPLSVQNEYIILADNHMFYDANHILVINKKMFHEAVQQNLSLFQYILGPQVTPESLFKEITSNTKSFFSILKKDRVLIGILLGYGTENSIVVSRTEDLFDYYYTSDQIPFKSKFSKENNDLKTYNVIFFNELSLSASHAIDKPSFGFSNFESELSELSAKTETASKKLRNENPPFIYGRLKNESHERILELEKTQSDIQKWVADPNFLNQIISKFYGNDFSLVESNSSKYFQFTKDEIQHIHKLLASKIFDRLHDKNKKYQTGYEIGLNKAANGDNVVNTLTSFEDICFDQVTAAVDNLHQADSIFKKLATDPAYNQTDSNKIYYRIIENGQGKTLNGVANATMHCSVKSPNNKLLYDSEYEGLSLHIDIDELLPAIAHGMQGMQEGEVREIIIHPSVGYGMYTNLEKGIYLTVNVELEAINAILDRPLSDLQEADFTKIINRYDKYHNTDYLVEVGTEDGYKFWNHFKKADFLSFSEIMAHLNLLQTGKEKHIEYSHEDDILLTRLHWNIYHQEK